ncbi:Rhamnolipids biosynthesis 3-oxoacyl-reductase [Podospora fimiseda]|uniref:Rhamnolipids biosynthesis 3-oxoacyl-reductase n=1 Tax=Podospora fimiseda TaxID=252190 RepID=A0AAN7BVB4_9PEZI|nr:Rhamnolipids biosynthesis 3-oxoacyl-reductase [Podospora fimiseda]
MISFTLSPHSSLIDSLYPQKMDIPDLFSVKNKVVLITGGAKGLGRMISEGFVRNGAKVYISSRDAKACEVAAKELNSISSPNKGSAHALPADLQSLDQVKSLVSTLTSLEPSLNILINNSGATWGAPLESYPDEAFTKLLTLNLQRVFTLTQLLLPLLQTASTPSDPSRIIHIGSIDGIRVPSLPTFAYSASKAGLHHLSRHLAVELGPKGITSNTLACGPFPSKMMAHTLETFGEEIKGANPLGRIGSPGDVAGTCIFLASKAGAYVNGATITLDGGVHLISKI